MGTHVVPTSQEKGKDHIEHDKSYKLFIILSFFLVRLGFKGRRNVNINYKNAEIFPVQAWVSIFKKFTSKKYNFAENERINCLLELSNNFLTCIVTKNIVFCIRVSGFVALFSQDAFSLARQMWKKILVFIFLELSSTFLTRIVTKNFDALFVFV